MNSPIVNPANEETLSPGSGALPENTLPREQTLPREETVQWHVDGAHWSRRICQWLVDDGRLSADQIDVVRQAVAACGRSSATPSDSGRIELSDSDLASLSLSSKNQNASQSRSHDSWSETSRHSNLGRQHDSDSDRRSDSDRLTIGTRVADYQIVDTVGRGGSGLVYAVRHCETGQSLALKVLSSSMTSQRFEREMDLVCRLAHPNIVFAHQVGQCDGLWYIAMERLSGPDVRQWVINDGPLDWQTTLPIIYQIAGALQQAHTRGLVHRDVKPGNLICDGDGVVKLADLGLAAMLTPEIDGGDAGGEPSFHTRIEALGGTPGYMAPEQAHSLAAADDRSDIYSLGATWYYMLTGRSMVPGDTWSARLGELIRGDHIRTLSADQLPQPFLDLWQSMVHRDPEQRLQKVSQVITMMKDSYDPKLLGGADRSIRVLVVEDDQDDLFITLQSLRRFNTSVDVESAQSLDAAITMATTGNFEAVLLDLQLPDATGLEAVSQFRESCPDVAIIVLSGRDDEGIDQACRLRGADEFVTKHSVGVPEMERLIFIALAKRK